MFIGETLTVSSKGGKFFLWGDEKQHGRDSALFLVATLLLLFASPVLSKAPVFSISLHASLSP